MSDCFRPGDIIRAEVVSLGDARSYYLTTSRNELGVVYAKSMAAGALTCEAHNQQRRAACGSSPAPRLTKPALHTHHVCAKRPSQSLCCLCGCRCANGAHQLGGDAVPRIQEHREAQGGNRLCCCNGAEIVAVAAAACKGTPPMGHKTFPGAGRVPLHQTLSTATCLSKSTSLS